MHSVSWMGASLLRGDVLPTTSMVWVIIISTLHMFLSNFLRHLRTQRWSDHHPWLPIHPWDKIQTLPWTLRFGMILFLPFFLISFPYSYPLTLCTFVNFLSSSNIYILLDQSCLHNPGSVWGWSISLLLLLLYLVNSYMPFPQGSIHWPWAWGQVIWNTHLLHLQFHIALITLELFAKSAFLARYKFLLAHSCGHKSSANISCNHHHHHHHQHHHHHANIQYSALRRFLVHTG